MSGPKFYGTPREWGMPKLMFLLQFPVEVTEDEFDHMLGVLPPVGWRRPDAFERACHGHIETFFLLEAQIGDIRAQYGKVQARVNVGHPDGANVPNYRLRDEFRYFMKYALPNRKDTHLTRELIDNGLRCGIIQKGTGFCNG